MILRPYQSAAVEAVADWARTHPGAHPLLVLPTGAGKTAVMSGLVQSVRAADRSARVLILAHRKELLEQSVQTAFRIFPSTDIGVYAASLGRKDTRAPLTVASIQSLAKDPFKVGAQTMVLVDECFPAGTMITTPTGMRAIEAVQVGDAVCHAFGVDRVRATSTRIAPRLVTVHLNTGTSIECTEHHPIFTEAGWVRAGELEPLSRVYRDEDVRALQRRVSAVGEARGRRVGSAHHEAARVGEAALLQYLVLESERERDARSDGAGEDARDVEAHRASAVRSRRQWYGADARAVALPGDTRERVGAGVGVSDGATHRGYSDVLQSGSWAPSVADCNRVGRTNAHRHTVDRGSAEGCVSSQPWVVGVSRRECEGGTRVFNLDVSGHPSYFADGLLVHNCHLVPNDHDTSFRKTLQAMHTMKPGVCVVGLTATPYRLGSGLLHEGDGRLFSGVAYEVRIPELLAEGFLCPVKPRATTAVLSTAGVAVRGDYVPAQLAARVDVDAITQAIVAECVRGFVDRACWLVFACSVEHAEHLADAFRTAGVTCAAVHGELSAGERSATLAAYKSGAIRCVVNCELLTTGFDHPAIDAIAMCRPTKSPGLYYQQVGRGFRPHANKTNCVVLDFAGNVLQHGPVDTLSERITTREKGDGLAPAKSCPDCQALVATAVAICPECGHAFPPPKAPALVGLPSARPLLSTDVPEPTWEDVTGVEFSINTPRVAGKLPTLRVDYQRGWQRVASEWICFDHTGYAHSKAILWWRERFPDSDVPVSVDEAYDWICGAPAMHTAPSAVCVMPDGDFQRITGYRWPEARAVWLRPSMELPRACWTCRFMDPEGLCTLAGDTPPDDVSRVGCECYALMQDADDFAATMADGPSTTRITYRR